MFFLYQVNSVRVNESSLSLWLIGIIKHFRLSDIQMFCSISNFDDSLLISENTSRENDFSANS